ncbi:MAG TPA: endolytic transglycosylase MltG [Bryobacteraceae bacterium]|nr:endolytic transglycosylase MltG [Bryobacteraceae bacterium]
MSRRRSCLGCLVRLFLLFVLLLAAAGAGAYWLLNQPYQGFTQPVVLEFPKGTSTASMGKQLAQAGVLRYDWEFLLARALRPDARLQAGEYQFTRPASALTVFDRIVRGDVFYYEITVPEGSNMFDISAAIDRLGFLHGTDFLRIARDPAMISDLDPKAPTLEGYLFPSTYRVTRSATVQQLCHMMTDLFRKHWRELQKADQPADVHDTVTLASMVEKETAVADERPTVASVYQNRLRLHMTLDCDPTTIYAALLEQRYRGVIYRSDLESTNEYNTYRHTGLPPGPIASPGASALKAALSPAETDYLYFVAKPDGSGGHQFSKSMAEHNRAVQLYRQRHGK